MPRPASVSFVIPVRNDAVRLRRCLTSIAGNIDTSISVQCVVADNGSTDETVAVAKASGATVLSVPGPVSRVRNVAAGSADGELLAFVDADHEIAATWVAAAADVLRDESVGAAGALCLPPPDGTPVQRMYGVLRGRTRGSSDVTWLGSGNLLIRKEIFASLGGFDERLETCEDVDLCQRLREGGWRLVGDERLLNIHLGDPATLKAVFTSERWRGRDNLRVSFRRVPALRDWPSILFPIAGAAGLVTLAVALVAWPFLGTVAGVAAAVALLAVVGPSLLRTLRMLTGEPAPESVGLAFMVALAYDLGRACSLLMPAGHRQRQRTERPVPRTDA